MSKRKASPFIPHWPDAIAMNDLEGIRDHWHECITEYTTRVANGEVMWARHLRVVHDRHLFWAALVKRRQAGERIAPLVREYLGTH